MPRKPPPDGTPMPRPIPLRPPAMPAPPITLPIAAEIADPVLPSDFSDDGAANLLGGYVALLIQDASRGAFGLRGQKMNNEALAYTTTREAAAMVAGGAAGDVDDPMISLCAALLGKPPADVWVMIAARVRAETALLQAHQPANIARPPAKAA